MCNSDWKKIPPSAARQPKTYLYCKHARLTEQQISLCAFEQGLKKFNSKKTCRTSLKDKENKQSPSYTTPRRQRQKSHPPVNLGGTLTRSRGRNQRVRAVCLLTGALQFDGQTITCSLGAKNDSKRDSHPRCVFFTLNQTQLLPARHSVDLDSQR